MDQQSDGRATHGAADGKTGMRRAQSDSVLCGKYSSTLRKVQIQTPQGVRPYSAGGRPETGHGERGKTAGAAWRAAVGIK